ncbi:mevalonate kinase family protein [Aquirufa regiilacus]|uniref:Galactokinase family protein n=1 Tax=Aquirufa regiilacus TaxID=3024868 RepID=A0ABU3TP77_9BACT|nr:MULTISPECIES: galactokinase family protein [unclassified Aquirufa]MDT8887056.1 galactokinase family protein [Aquirufa sp. LEPPI-3A]MDU0807667.1 galactokinase family protein [Aquirufa sp. LEOWEIH-7C]
MIVSTPGRICLFGEHQDYLGLPVIAAAISKRIQLKGAFRPDRIVHFDLPDIQKTESFSLEFPLEYTQERDYFKSVLNVLSRKGHVFEKGLEIEVRGNIPINSGTSSSSALLVSWVELLNEMYQLGYSQKEVGEITYEAEVLEFTEPGGMMDQYSTAVGNVIYLASQPAISITTYQQALGTFVLGDSGEPKDTLGILSRVKFGTLGGIQKIKAIDPGFDLATTTQAVCEQYRNLLTEDEWVLLTANLSDRDILLAAKKMFEGEEPWDDHRLGVLLTDHQKNLREYKQISTPKIDRMIDAALGAGALGAKINGSGGGGCMFAYAPNNPEAVVAAIEQAGGKAYIIRVDVGTQEEKASLFY